MKMIGGFNTNIRHRGVLFHVQTEDSGLAKPHVITHLYHGGNIMHSQKTSYAEHVGSSEVANVVKKLMEEQHKAKLKALRRGEFDDIIRERLGPDVFGNEPATPAKDSDADAKEDSLSTTVSPPTQTDLDEANETSARVVAASGTENTETRDTQTIVTRPVKPGRSAAGAPRVFGEGIITEKPLDELVLGYLVDSARKRKKSDP